MGPKQFQNRIIIWHIFFRILNLLANWKLIDYLAEIHGNSHISNPTSKFFWLHCAAGLGRATRGVWGRLISIIGSALRNSNLDLVTSAELNQAARLDGDATHCGTTCEKLDRILFFDRKYSVFFWNSSAGFPKKSKMSIPVLILPFFSLWGLTWPVLRSLRLRLNLTLSGLQIQSEHRLNQRVNPSPALRGFLWYGISVVGPFGLPGQYWKN